MLQLEPGVRLALDEVQAKGKADGNEHACMVRNGLIVWRGDGGRDSVDVRTAPRGPGNVGVHNHPDSLNSLSSGDLTALFRRDIDAIYAIAVDGSVYKASKPHAEWGVFEWFAAFDRVRNDLVEKQGMQRYFGSADFARYLNSAHWVNRLMASVGVFDYQYELGETAQAKVAELDKSCDFPRLITNFKANVEGRLERLSVPDLPTVLNILAHSVFR